MSKFDIRRRLQEIDVVVGGVTITSTAIETREVDLQNLNGTDALRLGGLRLEANYKGFCHKDSNVREGDVISRNSGTTKYEIVFVDDLFNEHVQFYAKKVE